MCFSAWLVLQAYDSAMKRNGGTIGVSTLILVTLASCGVPPASMDTTPSSSAVPCHGAYVADVDTSVPGEPTFGMAAEAWAKSAMAPSGAPSGGWDVVDGVTMRSGDWAVGLTQTVGGGWVVSGLGCGITQS